MMSPDPSTLATRIVSWDGKPLHIGERDVLVGNYTFGASDKCRITLSFTNLIITGLTGKPGDNSMSFPDGCNWLQVRWPGTGDLVAGFQIGSGFFDFNADSGQPTTAWQFKQIVQAGLTQINAPTSQASWSTFGDIAAEVFTLQVTFDRTTTHPNITVDFRSGNIVLTDSMNHTAVQPSDEQIPPSFEFRTGSRLLSEGIQDNYMFTPAGAYGHTITEFSCVDVP